MTNTRLQRPFRIVSYGSSQLKSWILDQCQITGATEAEFVRQILMREMNSKVTKPKKR